MTISRGQEEIAVMFEAPVIVGTCINCIWPGSLLATLTVIVFGFGFAVQSERRKARLISQQS
jgi:hypothetical protein